MEHSETAFISYSRTDSIFALRLANEMREIGYNIWIDALDIIAGNNWDLSIENALQNCSTVIFILSPEAVDSKTVMDEVSFAIEENKRIVPILYKACKIPFRIKRIQYCDFTNSYDKGFIQIKQALKTIHKISNKGKSEIDDTSNLSFMPFEMICGIKPGETRLNELTNIFGKPDKTEEKIELPGENRIFHYNNYGLVFGSRTSMALRFDQFSRSPTRGDSNPIINYAYAIFPFKGKSPNGLYIGMTRSEALTICKRFYYEKEISDKMALFYETEERELDIISLEPLIITDFRLWFEKDIVTSVGLYHQIKDHFSYR